MRAISERGNTWTHLPGAAFALGSLWLLGPAARGGRLMAAGVAVFLAGMFLMYLCSSLYHWAPPGRVKDILRRCDHISIYVMIAASYTPLCLCVIGGGLGWAVLVLQWAAALGGACYKLLAFGRHPRLSLGIYLAMGWSVLLVAPRMWERLSALPLSLLLAEGVFYTAGTYFFAHDSRPRYHAVWHVFVLLGSGAHWGAVASLVLR